MGGWDGNADLGEDLIHLQSRLVEARKKTGQGDHPLAIGTGGHDPGLQRQHRGRMVVGGVRVRQVPSHRGHIADQGVTDHSGRLHQNRVFRAEQVRAFDLGLSREGSDPEEALRLPDVAQPRNAVDIDEVTGCGEAQLHQRNQAHPPRQYFCFRPKLPDQTDRLT